MALNYFPSARGWRRLSVCLLIGAAWIASAQPAKGESNEITLLRAEVQRLASELLQDRVEFIRWKMHWMIGELQQVQAERQRLGSERQLIEREIGELNLAATNSPGGEDEDRKQELSAVQLPALLASERSVVSREAALVAALSSESGRITEIQKQLQRLAGQGAKEK